MDVELRGTLEIEGDSTLRRYHARTNDLRAALELGDPARAGDDLGSLVQAGQVSRVELTIPIERLVSGDAMLDRHLRAALKAEAFPMIRFVADDVRASSGSLTLAGRLELGGVARPVNVVARAGPAPGGLRVSGRQELSMTQLGLKPPTLMFGTLKVADRVVVKFDLEARLPAAPPRPIGDRS